MVKSDGQMHVSDERWFSYGFKPYVENLIIEKKINLVLSSKVSTCTTCNLFRMQKKTVGSSITNKQTTNDTPLQLLY